MCGEMGLSYTGDACHKIDLGLHALFHIKIQFLVIGAIKAKDETNTGMYAESTPYPIFLKKYSPVFRDLFHIFYGHIIHEVPVPLHAPVDI